MNRIFLTTALGLTLAASVANAQEPETISVNGQDLIYVSEGEGTPVVFVHGAISDHRVWEPLRAAISAEHRFVAYDQRYFGRAEWPDDGAGYSVEAHVSDLVALVEALDAGPVHLVTWSYSGEIGVQAAERSPRSFKSVTHFEPSVVLKETMRMPGFAAAQKAMFSTYGPVAAAMENGTPEDAALRMLEWVFKMEEGSAGQAAEPWPEIWRTNGRTIAKMNAGWADARVLTCDEVSAITVPTLIVQGENVSPWFSAMAETLARCQPNTLTVTMSGVNHDGPYRKPDELAEMILDFIDLVE